MIPNTEGLDSAGGCVALEESSRSLHSVDDRLRIACEDFYRLWIARAESGRERLAQLPGILALPKIPFQISPPLLIFKEIEIGHYVASLVIGAWRERDAAGSGGVGRNRCPLELKTSTRGRFTVFVLSGRIEKEALVELRRLFESQPDCRDIVLDLKDVTVINREVMRFLAHCEVDGVKLENCTPYIREWMEREKD